MKGTPRFASDRMFFAIVAVLASWLSAFPILANAQGTQGQNAVYPVSGTCCVGSPAFIDASMFNATAPNICGILHNILNGASYPSAGAVIDARGLNSGNTSMTCTTTNPSPWAGINNPPPSTILLPATATAPIVIPSTWVLPPNTKLIGESDNIGRVAQLLERRLNQTLGAPSFRVLCERVGGSVRMLWAAMPISQRGAVNQ